MAATGEDAPLPVPRKKLSAVALLPAGSQLQGVMLPRYDDKRRLTGVLKAKTMTLVSEEVIAGETVSIEFFNPDRSPRGRIDLVKAVLDQGKGLLRAREKVIIQADRIHARGNGLVYSFEQGEGFLTGPAITRILANTETTMNSKSTPLRSAATAIAATATLAAAPPAPLTPEQSAAIQSDAASAAATHAEASDKARAELGTTLDASNAVNAAAKDFLQQTELLAAGATGKAADLPQAKPLDIQPGPNDTVISCDGGMYFDPDKGVFVYLKNVRVTDPRFTLSGAEELKVFLGKKPETPGDPPDKNSNDETAFAGKFNEVERIVATGAILIDQKSVNGREPIKASGAIFIYNVKADHVIINGGFPWVVQGGIALRAREHNLTLNIYPKAGKFDTEGAWDTFLPLEKLQKKQP